MTRTNLLYFEDIQVGQTFLSGDYPVTKEEIIEFAQKWDPRDIHLDEEIAERSAFGSLIASGAHVTAICTKLSLEAVRRNSEFAVIAGLGSENKLDHPVYPNDILHYRGEIVEKRTTESNENAGIVKTHQQLRNQDDVVVFERTIFTMVKKRFPSSAG